MARVSPETSRSHLSLDVAVAPGQKGGVDPTLIGAFDETLRLARQPERERASDVASPSQETRPADERGGASETSEREPREKDDASSEDVDRTPVADGETKSSEAVESEDTRVEAGSEESSEQTDVEEEDAAPDETQDESPVEAEADTAAIVVPLVQEPVAEGAEKSVSEEGQGEQGSSDTRVEEATRPQVSDSRATEAVVTQSAGEAGVDEATVATEGVDETVDMPLENPGEEAESETEQGAADGDRGKVTKSDEKPDADTTRPLEEPNNTNELAGPSEELSHDEATGETAERRPRSARGKQREVASTQAGGSQGASADVVQSGQTEAGLAAAAVQETGAAAETLTPPPEAIAADSSATQHASQATASGDVVTAVESKSSNAPSQANAGQDTGKGTAQGVDSAKFVQRVTSAFLALGQRSGPVRLKLYPPELGSLRMEITVKNGTLSARVEAETAAARGVLVDNLPVLRERLAEQGIKVDRFDVEVSDQSQGGPSERPGDGGRSSKHADRQTESHRNQGEREAESNERRDEGRISIDGRLDVFI